VSAALFLAAVILTPAYPRAGAPEDELPDGEGKKILQASCTSCHNLGEVTKFRGYYTKAQWRDVVVTMVEYGADLKEPEVDTLVDYLAQHLGRP
jgi:mono/diheme cytochrome c family protein